MPMPPLGRSLIPLPGESLPGFILRLSCRLQLPPARLAALTGLVPAGHSGARAPVSLLTEIPEPARRTFAHMTRLTTGKVAQLGLACLQERYPLPAGAAKNAATIPLSGLLVFAPATRYCPDCLAGDGSPIQDAFGGPWRKIWHLPVVFACTLHQRLLEDRCPECGQVTHSRYLGAPVPMLPAMRAGTLHPSQCRTALDPGRGRTLPTCCGTRLDHTPALRPADPELITLQHKILGLLGPDGPAHTLSAGRPGRPGPLLHRSAGAGAAGLLDLARDPAPEPLARDSGGHRPACRGTSATNRRPAEPLPVLKSPRHVRPSAHGRRSQRRPGAHR